MTRIINKLWGRVNPDLDDFVSKPPYVKLPPVDSSSAVVVQHLTKSYGDVLAVCDLSFTVPAGTIYGLVGANGAGKTTTLRTLAGLSKPTSGTVRILDADPTTDPLIVKRALGFHTGDTALWGRITPRETLQLFADLCEVPVAESASRIEALIAELELGAFVDRRCETLSTGQRQRTAIARTLIHDPAVLVLDEPTAALDVVAARFILDRLRLEAQRGKAVIFSTHHLSEVELVSDRIGVIHAGRLLAEGTVDDLLERTGKRSLTEAFLALVDATRVEDVA